MNIKSTEFTYSKGHVLEIASLLRCNHGSVATVFEIISYYPAFHVDSVANARCWVRMIEQIEMVRNGHQTLPPEVAAWVFENVPANGTAS